MTELSEKQAIAALKRLAKKWPKTLWLFAAPGGLHVMRRGDDGDHVRRKNDSIDPEYILESIDIPNDGGDW